MSSYREVVSTLHCARENGSNLQVNEYQKTHYHARSTEEEEEECQIAIFYFTRRTPKLSYYGDVIHPFGWKSGVEYDGGV